LLWNGTYCQKVKVVGLLALTVGALNGIGFGSSGAPATGDGLGDAPGAGDASAGWAPPMFAPDTGDPEAAGDAAAGAAGLVSAGFAGSAGLAGEAGAGWPQAISVAGRAATSVCRAKRREWQRAPDESRDQSPMARARAEVRQDPTAAPERRHEAD
jgi:hypothetical protein